MAKVKKVLVLGKGRIGKAIEYYLKKYSPKTRVSFLTQKTNFKNYLLLISTLPGDMGEMGLELALKFKKDLIDVSDVEHEFYLRHKKEIKKKGILVVPGCGFSPGLTNFICGKEVKENRVKEIEILAGTLSSKKNFFPFLWCFEDLIEGHTLKATFIKNGRRIWALPFSDYRKEKIEGIEAESYLGDGLTSLPYILGIKNMSYRTLRPAGFYSFFEYLENHGFFRKENLVNTKRTLEGKKEDNLTLGEIRIKTQKKKIIWRITSFSKKNEKLNSMQKITAISPAILAEIILKGNFSQKGLFFPEELGEERALFGKILKGVGKEILIRRKVR